MYENMKPKDAARIFDSLEMNILVKVSTQINPRTMSSSPRADDPRGRPAATVSCQSRQWAADSAKSNAATENRR